MGNTDQAVCFNTIDDCGSLLIVQITDPHLRKERDGQLLGMNTDSSLDAVLQLIRDNHKAPSLMLATGDIAQDGSVEAYHSFKQKIGGFECPIYWFSGNHDDRAAMQKVAGNSELQKVIRTEKWQLVFLDTLVPGKVYGQLADAELTVLENALSERLDLHTLVCFHHHPIDIDSEWLDNIGLKNRDQLLDIIDRHSNVRGLLWGHIHQEVDRERNGVRLLATPSTCVQFLPKSKDFAIDPLAPGYRWLKLGPDGTIDTGVNRADNFEFTLDFNSKGY